MQHLNKYALYASLAVNYVKVIIDESLDWFHQYLIVLLPSYMFSQVAVQIIESQDSDSSETESTSEAQCAFVIFTANIVINDIDGVYNCKLAPAQLMSFVDECAAIKFNSLLRHYPNAGILDVTYFKKCGDQAAIVTQKIDLIDRKNLISGQRCKFGRIQL